RAGAAGGGAVRAAPCGTNGARVGGTRAGVARGPRPGLGRRTRARARDGSTLGDRAAPGSAARPGRRGSPGDPGLRRGPRLDAGSSASLVPVSGDARARVFALRGARGRVYAVPFVVALADPPHVAEAMGQPVFDPAHVALTTEGSVEGEYPGSSRCAIRWLRD